MGRECEHADGDFVGKCSICGDMVCGECFQTIFNTVICSMHEELEDESSWELIGFYTSQSVADERRYFLQDQQVTSIVVETEDDIMEMYVPTEEKDDAFDALQGAAETVLQCDSCKVFYSEEVGACPICGVRQVNEET